ncbi:MAG: hypothetical protein MR606_00750 [Mollicutes bacterium]|nr:hypothetical protein [Mollicutes bacterium]MDD7263767.1 hypothetical protein [bacterium]MDY4979962.1 hypothetical protein [Candidatus Onthovivens sp.]
MYGFYVLMTLIVLGWITTYGAGISYLKKLRGEKTESKINDITVIVTSILFGSLINLLLYCLFDEIRLEDSTNKNRFLISSIVLLCLHILLIFLLFYFKVIQVDFIK